LAEKRWSWLRVKHRTGRLTVCLSGRFGCRLRGDIREILGTGLSPAAGSLGPENSLLVPVMACLLFPHHTERIEDRLYRPSLSRFYHLAHGKATLELQLGYLLSPMRLESLTFSRRWTSDHLPFVGDGPQLTYLLSPMRLESLTFSRRWTSDHLPFVGDGPQLTYLLSPMDPGLLTFCRRWTPAYLPFVGDGPRLTYLSSAMTLGSLTFCRRWAPTHLPFVADRHPVIPLKNDGVKVPRYTESFSGSSLKERAWGTDGRYHHQPCGKGSRGCDLE
jgi:hypothetical protein